MSQQLPRPFAGKWLTRWWLKVERAGKQPWMYLGKPNLQAWLRFKKLAAKGPIGVHAVEFDRAGIIASRFTKAGVQPVQINDWAVWCGEAGHARTYVLYHPFDEAFRWVERKHTVETLATAVGMTRLYKPVDLAVADWKGMYRKRVALQKGLIG